MIYGIIFFVMIICIGILLLFSNSKKPQKLPESIKKDFEKKLRILSKSPSYKEQILDCDKLYHKILKAYGFEGTFGEILKTNPSLIQDIDEIWRLHKLRNKLAHEFDNYDEKFLMQNARKFRDEIGRIL